MATALLAAHVYVLTHARTTRSRSAAMHSRELHKIKPNAAPRRREKGRDGLAARFSLAFPSLPDVGSALHFHSLSATRPRRRATSNFPEGSDARAPNASSPSSRRRASTNARLTCPTIVAVESCDPPRSRVPPAYTFASPRRTLRRAASPHSRGLSRRARLSREIPGSGRAGIEAREVPIVDGNELTYHGGQTAVSVSFRETAGIAGRHTLHNIQLIETPYSDVITCTSPVETPRVIYRDLIYLSSIRLDSRRARDLNRDSQIPPHASCSGNEILPKNSLKILLKFLHFLEYFLAEFSLI